jgi:hypothetical protein
MSIISDEVGSVALMYLYREARRAPGDLFSARYEDALTVGGSIQPEIYFFSIQVPLWYPYR